MVCRILKVVIFLDDQIRFIQIAMDLYKRFSVSRIRKLTILFYDGKRMCFWFYDLLQQIIETGGVDMFRI